MSGGALRLLLAKVASWHKVRTTQLYSPCYVLPFSHPLGSEWENVNQQHRSAQKNVGGVDGNDIRNAAARTPRQSKTKRKSDD